MTEDKSKALSTGQVARYCYVTSYTIVNWIKSGRLKAHRTAGGQYRVLVSDLRRFLLTNSMRTDLLDEEQHTRPYCWEFHCRGGSDEGMQERCRDCLVRKSGALNCFSLQRAVSGEESVLMRCMSCDYFAAWGLDEDETSEPKSPNPNRCKPCE